MAIETALKFIPTRMDRRVSEADRALDWWRMLDRDEKTRWLQCAVSAEQVDELLQSPVLSIREAASFGAIGDAWDAWRQQALTTLDFNDVIRAGGGLKGSGLKPRDRYERDANAWHAAGRPALVLETGTLELIALRCWFYSDGYLWEQAQRRLSEAFLDYLNACLERRWNDDHRWYEEALHERTHCDRCGERYMLENLSLCTDCLSVYCFECVTDFPKAENGNRAHGCAHHGSSGGELVG